MVRRRGRAQCDTHAFLPLIMYRVLALLKDRGGEKPTMIRSLSVEQNRVSGDDLEKQHDPGEHIIPDQISGLPSPSCVMPGKALNLSVLSFLTHCKRRG